MDPTVSLFSLFFPGIISELGVVFGRNPGPRGSGEQKTAKTPAVPPLFFAVFAPKNSDNRENLINAKTKLLRAVAQQLHHLEYHVVALFCQLDKYLLASLLSAIVGAGSGSRCAGTTSHFVSHYADFRNELFATSQAPFKFGCGGQP